MSSMIPSSVVARNRTMAGLVVMAVSNVSNCSTILIRLQVPSSLGSVRYLAKPHFVAVQKKIYNQIIMWRKEDHFRNYLLIQCHIFYFLLRLCYMVIQIKNFSTKFFFVHPDKLLFPAQ